VRNLTGVQFVTSRLKIKAAFRIMGDCTLERKSIAVQFVTNRLHKKAVFMTT
jgi:hypothetical protein